MTNGERYVTWDRWDAEHRALTGRLDDLERLVAERWQDEQAARNEHRKRVWQATLAIVTGLVLPLIVLGILAILHAHAH